MGRVDITVERIGVDHYRVVQVDERGSLTFLVRMGADGYIHELTSPDEPIFSTWMRRIRIQTIEANVHMMERGEKDLWKTSDLGS